MNWNTPEPAVVISVSRGGGTFLCHCLDSHPEIACERGEPLGSNAPWMQAGINRDVLMRVLWTRSGYRVSMFKLTYKQARWYGMEDIKGMNVRVMHLHRENALRVIISNILGEARSRGESDHPAHAYEVPSPPPPVHVDPAWLVSECCRYEEDVASMLNEIAALDVPWMSLTYGDMVGGEGTGAAGLTPEVQIRVCEFLSVAADSLMVSTTVRVNPWPLAEIVENWNDVRAAIVKDGSFVKYLEEA